MLLFCTFQENSTHSKGVYNNVVVTDYKEIVTMPDVYREFIICLCEKKMSKFQGIVHANT